MEYLKTLTNYIAVWGWQIMAILFLLFSFLFFALPRTTMTSAFYVACFLVFIGCEFISLKRKRELLEDE